MANSHSKSNLSFVVSTWRQLDWTSMIVLTLGTALVAFLALALRQYRPLISAVESLPVFEFIGRLTSAL